MTLTLVFSEKKSQLTGSCTQLRVMSSGETSWPYPKTIMSAACSPVLSPEEDNGTITCKIIGYLERYSVDLPQGGLDYNALSVQYQRSVD